MSQMAQMLREPQRPKAATMNEAGQVRKTSDCDCCLSNLPCFAHLPPVSDRRCGSLCLCARGRFSSVKSAKSAAAF
jgi:hypothetical protein